MTTPTGPSGLVTFSREEFVDRRWDYKPGNHVTIIGPTGSGKTVLGMHLLAKYASAQMPVVYLVKKPRDPEITAWGKTLGLVRTDNWPPSPWLQMNHRNPPGWMLWPRTRFDPDLDRPHKHVIFRRALVHAYKGGGIFKQRPRIVVLDDSYGLAKILDLEDEMIENWTEMRAMGGGQWSFFQKPSHVPLWAYQADHLFLFNEPDKRSRQRFGEIGGIDADVVTETVVGLDEFQALYIRRRGRRACIVDR